MKIQPNIEAAWKELETRYPFVSIFDWFEGENYEVWTMYYKEQSWEYNATVLMLYLVSQGETLS